MLKNNNQGMTLVEIMIALGLVGILSIGVISISKSQGEQALQGSQEDMIGAYTKAVATGLRSKVSCDNILLAGLGGALDFSGLELPMKDSVRYTGAQFLPVVSTTGLETLPINILLQFERRLFNGNNTTVLRKVSALGKFQDGVFQECLDFESEASQSSLKLACETVGATYVIDGAGNESCDFMAISSAANFSVGVKRYLCEELFNGSYDAASNRCQSIEVPGLVVGENIDSLRFRLNGKWRSSFNQNCTGANTFIRGINVDGTVSCHTITTCTKDLDC